MCVAFGSGWCGRLVGGSPSSSGSARLDGSEGSIPPAGLVGFVPDWRRVMVGSSERVQRAVQDMWDALESSDNQAVRAAAVELAIEVQALGERLAGFVPLPELAA